MGLGVLFKVSGPIICLFIIVKNFFTQGCLLIRCAGKMVQINLGN